jgi:hypothetical protein
MKFAFYNAGKAYKISGFTEFVFVFVKMLELTAGMPSLIQSLMNPSRDTRSVTQEARGFNDG